MYHKGYIASGTLTSESFRNAQLAVGLAQQESAYALYKKFTAPKTMKILRGEVTAAENVLAYQQSRLRRHSERLALLEEQVKNCTIRAPHDGFVIYANNNNREIVIEEGMAVRQHQQLFYLPDLNDMEVVAMLHESIVEQVIPTMRATFKSRRSGTGGSRAMSRRLHRFLYLTGERTSSISRESSSSRTFRAGSSPE